MSDYNYDAFKTEDYDFDAETGPLPGQKALDFLLTTSDGTPRKLLDFDGAFLVLELGSITCPLFQSRRKTMATLDDLSDRVSTAILYVREAHPGQLIPSHSSADVKHTCARRLVEEDGETRLVLVDDFEGSAHRAYGGMPNAVFIINRNGCVVFRSDWNNPSATRSALEALLDGKAVHTKSYFFPATPTTAIRTLRRAGMGSTKDFLKGLPSLIWANVIKRNLRLVFNRQQPVAHDATC